MISLMTGCGPISVRRFGGRTPIKGMFMCCSSAAAQYAGCQQEDDGGSGPEEFIPNRIPLPTGLPRGL